MTPEERKIAYLKHKKKKCPTNKDAETGVSEFVLRRVRIAKSSEPGVSKCEKCTFYKGVLFGCAVMRLDKFDCNPIDKDGRYDRYDFVFQIDNEELELDTKYLSLE